MSLNKEALKELRAQRKELIALAKENNKRMRAEAKPIKEALSSGPATIPQLAEKTGQSTDRVLWHVMALKKFGQVSEASQQGDYFLYALEDGANK